MKIASDMVPKIVEISEISEGILSSKRHMEKASTFFFN
jgi:hypothetical protein